MSGVRYVPIDGESVSEQWWVLLRDLRRAGVWFRVNEGHRTWERQQYFWDLYLSGRGNIAARPSHNAPHIRTGRFDHAIDFQNAAGVIQAARRRGVYLYLSVAGESWHVEADRDDLLNYWKAHKGPVEDAVGYAPVIKRGSRGPAVYRLQTMLRYKHQIHPGDRHGKSFWPYRSQSKAFGPRTEAAVKWFQRDRGLKADGVVGPATWRKLRARSK